MEQEAHLRDSRTEEEIHNARRIDMERQAHVRDSRTEEKKENARRIDMERQAHVRDSRTEEEKENARRIHREREAHLRDSRTEEEKENARRIHMEQRQQARLIHSSGTLSGVSWNDYLAKPDGPLHLQSNAQNIAKEFHAKMNEYSLKSCKCGHLWPTRSQVPESEFECDTCKRDIQAKDYGGVRKFSVENNTVMVVHALHKLSDRFRDKRRFKPGFKRAFSCFSCNFKSKF